MTLELLLRIFQEIKNFWAIIYSDYLLTVVNNRRDITPIFFAYPKQN